MSVSSSSESVVSYPDKKAGATVWVRVALDVPLQGLFDYRCLPPVNQGDRVIVPFGRRKLIGVVVDLPAFPELDETLVRDVDQVLGDLPALPADWLRLAAFAASYYQRPLGEAMLPTLPVPLRRVGAYQGKRSAGGPVSRLDRRAGKTPAFSKASAQEVAAQAPVLNTAQQTAVDGIAQLAGHGVVLLHGVTGSGKTEVYLHAAQATLARGKQVLFMVPEINLTPQLEAVLQSRLAAGGEPCALAVMHSGLADGERLAAWVAAHRGRARVLLGTRMSVFAPMPELGLIIVDEEHDTSYKQQEGLRYSARDLAIWRARDLGVPVVLGSATPSLETWRHAESGHYQRYTLPDRARAAQMPRVRLVDTRRLDLDQGFSPQLTEAIGKRIQAGEQALVFLNRRGYAPVVNCASCGWVSQCPRCTAYAVLHRGPGRRNTLQCHHCGYQARVPTACPDCGDQDLKPMGRGTQRVEEYLAECFPEARIARIDADSTRLKGSAQALFSKVHAGEVDILVGTQMVAKGHDFARLGLVGVLNADAMLFAQDFRAPERLFAQLMQVAGRAGRHAAGGEVIIQTDYPDQAVYQALLRHDYVGFAKYGLAERKAVGLPPFAYQALLTAEAPALADALAFLAQARALPEQASSSYPTVSAITLYDPVPLRIVRVAHVERAQLLVESSSRPALQSFLSIWSLALHTLARGARIRYHLEIDPLEI
ncbi:primosomal protein N' [Allopusillimonas soli]|uniref:Replication restart protein PriA n=1 Tax=Allopusillimonas soli TaxID=659016 RepID=A0A853F8L0_9BURK|nr:primosomal protein N' [Allopusillimonas soli]NYT36289.1 primosomal protein N' [Allopusillimonas soli]TEA76612.1 primosomal protein N' [Allopusillimonas soli]